MIVDYHAHWYPPAFLESIEDRQEPPRAVRTGDGGWRYTVDSDPLGSEWDFPRRFQDLEVNIADMDAAGVDVSVISPTVPGDVSMLELGRAREALEILHSEFARAQGEHPDRLRCLAMLPLQSASASIEVLNRAIEDLGLAGVCINTNVAGNSIALPELLPVYERIEELGVPIFLHPANRSTIFHQVKQADGEESSGGRLSEVVLAWMYDTSLAALSLIFNGVLDKCPALNVVHPHVGGVIPYLTGRIDVAVRFHQKEVSLERPVGEYLATNFYTDIASGPTPLMLELGAQAYGRSHVLLGSDYPFIFPRTRCTGLLDQLEESFANEIRTNRLPGLELPPVAAGSVAAS